MNTFVIKLLLMPTVIGLVTWISKKWGNQWGGIIGSLPWIGGPIVLFFILEQGLDFTLNTIKSIIIGTIGVITFCFAYVYSSLKFSWKLCLLLSYLAYFTVSILLGLFEKTLSAHIWYVIGLLILLVSLVYFPLFTAKGEPTKILKYDVFIRMFVITFFVILITYLAHILGPSWSGILTPFPIMTAILAAFTHYTQGTSGTSSILKGMMIGFTGFMTFFYALYLFLPNHSIFVSFLSSLIINVCVTFFIKWVVKKWTR